MVTKGRRPPISHAPASRSSLYTDPGVQRKLVRSAAPEHGWGLGVARVMSVDSDSYRMTLQVVLGASDDQERLPVPIPFPAAGRAHMVGALPMVGDYCVVGWTPMESTSPRTRTPIVLGWVLPGLYAALGGAATALVSPEEADVQDPAVAQALGALAEHRHRTIPIEPGNVLAASAQGADLVLDDGAALSSRRGLGLQLRDPDQAWVGRSITLHQAAAGARVYMGPVRRDARLPPPFLEVGKDGPLLVAPPLGSGSTGDLLRRAGLVDQENRWTQNAREAMAAAGSSRQADRWSHVVPFGSGDPAADAGEACLAEWRVEVAGSARPRLPATDVADGFDAERLPDASGSNPPEVPVARLSVGAAVGNDPYGRGKDAYGKPLRARVFSGSIPAPDLGPMAAGEAADYPEDVLAFLLEVDMQEQGPAFVAVDRAGRAMASLGGAPSEDGAQVRVGGGIRVSAGGRLSSEAEDGVLLRDLSSRGISLYSEAGPVLIRGGGPGTSPGATANSPTVAVQAVGDARVGATKQVLLEAEQIRGSADRVRWSGATLVDVAAGGRLSIACQNGVAVYGATREEEHGGSRGPLHKRHYAPTLPGQVCEDVSYEMGDRSETFKLGSHSTHVVAGNVTYTVDVGSIKLRAGLNEVQVSTSGVQAQAVLGSATLSASVGTAGVSGLLGANLTALAGIAQVRGTFGVSLGSLIQGSEFGPIICAGSREPLTNLPFAFWGIGAPFHLVTP